MLIKMTEQARVELEERGYDITSISKQLADKIMQMPPVHPVDTCDNVQIADLELSWIRENELEEIEITIMTRAEAKMFDAMPIYAN